MAEKYIRENKYSYNITKGSKIFAKVTRFEDAIFTRDLLVSYDWELDKIPQIIKRNDKYLVLAVIDEKLHLLGRYESKPSQNTIDRLIKKQIRNPNNSKYGLNIMRFFDTFIIKKTIFGEEYVFGYYDNLEDAAFVRNFLLDNSWNVNKFNVIEFDDETDTFKVVCVIDDAVYVLDTFKSKSEIDLKKCYEEFLSRISKHKFGLANYPHLDLLTDKIEELELRFGVKTYDGTWSFDNLDDNSSPLNEIIFNLTPFQQSVYDVISQNTSFEEIKRALIRYKSGNFDAKIQKNIDELIEMDLVVESGVNTYSRKL